MSETLLRLVVSNPHLPARQESMHAQEPIQKTTPDNCMRHCFTTDVYLRNPYFYEMTAQAPSHYLTANFILELEEVQDEFASSVRCHFPNISDEDLQGFVWEDDILYSIIMIQFQMKVLERLLLFCATHNASTLIFFVDAEQYEALEIYHDFIDSQEQTLTSKGQKTKLVIPADMEKYHAWVDFMQATIIELRQVLWCEQRSSPAIKHYFKTHPF